MLKLRFLILLTASGVSKGYAYLMAPIIFSQYGAGILGEYVMLTTVSLLLTQIISLNPTALIIRSSDKAKDCIKYTFFYYILASTLFVIFCGIYIALNLLDNTNYYLLFFILASSEAMFTVVVAFFRANDMYVRFILIVVTKTLLIACYLFLAEANLTFIIIFSACISSLLSFMFIADKFWVKRKALFFNLTHFKLNRYLEDLLFGIKLIPHSLGLWGFSSATKVILKILAGSVSLGLFTVYFTFAFPVVLINSALTLYLPREIVRDPFSFVDKKKDVLFFKAYTLFVIILIMLIMLFCFFDNTYSFYIDKYSYISMASIIFSCITFYNFGTYQFLSNYLFYSKKSGVLSKNTVVSAVFSVLLSIVLAYYFDVLGAVIALYISSLFYVYVTFNSIKSLSQDNNAAMIWRSFCLYTPVLLVVGLSLGAVIL